MHSAKTTKRVRVGPLATKLGVDVEHGGGHLGVDVSWRDGVDANLARAKLAGHRAGDLEDRGLRGVVG